MQWSDEGYLLSKNLYTESSIIIEIFTLKHGKCTGIVYGGSSRKQKRNFQIGNKILINWISKGENKPGYFKTELIEPITPLFFDDKKRSITILSAASILKILLPEGQINESIYNSFEEMINELSSENWINLYINWEFSLIKALGFEVNLNNRSDSNKKFDNIITINNKSFKIPSILLKNELNKNQDNEIKQALIFNKNLLLENFILPNKLKFPLSRNILESYYS